MLPSGLVGVIETLRGRIERHRPALSQSEALTRYALIDPLLRELGWDTADPDLVTPEHRVGGGRADYALLGENGVTRAFIEAKRLGEPLETQTAGPIEQVFTYALTQQVKFAGLTDGNRWILDDVSDFSGGDRRKLDISISTEPVYQCALKLLLLWRPNLASGLPVPASEPIVAPVEVVPVVPNTPPPGQPFVDPSPSTPAGGSWVDVLDYTPGRKFGSSPAPTAILFLGGEEKPLQSWRGVLRETAEWLVRTGHLNTDRCPVMRGTTNCVVNTTSNHTSGRDFSSPRQLSNGLWLCERRGNYETSQSVKALLQKLGIAAGTVHIKFD